MIRLWLDNHLSSAVARALREKGHDVVAFQETPRSLRDLPDHLLLEEAAREGRALVTYNARDFAQLHRVHLAAGRSYTGIILISPHTIRQDNIGSQIRALDALLNEHAGDANARDQLIWIKVESS